MKLFLTSLFVFFYSLTNAQQFLELDTLSAPLEFENIYSKKIADDSLQTSFVIWIEENVRNHYHKEHTENILVLEGKADMTIGDKKLTIKKGDYLNIPKGTPHAVTKVYSRKPLKVLSIQSPQFDGTDRILITPPHADF